MKQIKANRCREKTSRPNSTKLNIIHSKPVLGKLISTLFSLLPTLFISCTHESGTYYPDNTTIKLELKSVEPLSSTDHIDLFTFNDNRLMQLDSYQRVEGLSYDKLSLRSQNGEKKIFAYRNSTYKISDWYNLRSYWGLENIYTSLRDEHKDAFTMSGEAEVTAGSAKLYSLTLKPFVSEIILRSIRCDFTGKPYEGLSIRNARAYLINVNARCSLISDDYMNPSEIINFGALDENMMSSFKEQSLLIQDIGTITKNTSRPNISLYCYPNACSEEGPGTPFTRLVIEGRLNGQTCWWPVNINRKSGTIQPGIHRNQRYIYDLTLRSKGSSGPDDPIEIEDIDIDMTIKSWKEKEDYSVEF